MIVKYGLRRNPRDTASLVGWCATICCLPDIATQTRSRRSGDDRPGDEARQRVFLTAACITEADHWHRLVPREPGRRSRRGLVERVRWSRVGGGPTAHTSGDRHFDRRNWSDGAGEHVESMDRGSCRQRRRPGTFARLAGVLARPASKWRRSDHSDDGHGGIVSR